MTYAGSPLGGPCPDGDNEAVRSHLPSGTVTFLVSDISGSTALLQEHGARFAELLAEHRHVLRTAFARHQGVEVDTQGDAFFVAFASARAAAAAAVDAQRALEPGPVRVRMGLHTGEAQVTDGTARVLRDGAPSCRHAVIWMP